MLCSCVQIFAVSVLSETGCDLSLLFCLSLHILLVPVPSLQMICSVVCGNDTLGTCRDLGTSVTSLHNSFNLHLLPQQEGFPFQLNILWVKYHWVFSSVLRFKYVYLIWLKLS